MTDTERQPPVAGDVPVAWLDGAPYLDLRTIDTPPKPLVAIIELIERPTTGNRVCIRIGRDPVHLYTELVDRGWSWGKGQDEDGSFLLTLTRNPARSDGPSA